jgi:beta-ketoacyl ACP reductase
MGANAFLTDYLVDYFVDKRDDIVLVGRKTNERYLKKNGVKNVITDYLDEKKLFEEISIDSKIEIIFVGTSTEPSLFVNLSDEDINNSIQKEIVFTIKFLKLLIFEMVKNNYGRVVFCGSKENDRGSIGGTLYSVVKNSHIGISRSIAVEYAKFGVTSNVLKLGLLPGGYKNKLKESELDNLIRRIPTKQLFEMLDIPQFIEVLLKSTVINGTEIDMDQAVR